MLGWTRVVWEWKSGWDKIDGTAINRILELYAITFCNTHSPPNRSFRTAYYYTCLLCVAWGSVSHFMDSGWPSHHLELSVAVTGKVSRDCCPSAFSWQGHWPLLITFCWARSRHVVSPDSWALIHKTLVRIVNSVELWSDPVCVWVGRGSKGVEELRHIARFTNSSNQMLLLILTSSFQPTCHCIPLKLFHSVPASDSSPSSLCLSSLCSTATLTPSRITIRCVLPTS